jgi:hypothetical protein
MTDIPAPVPVANQSPFAVSRLGQVAAFMQSEGERLEHEGMQRAAEVCLRRGHDEDEDVQLLVRALLFSYAHTRGIDVMALPAIHAH